MKNAFLIATVLLVGFVGGIGGSLMVIRTKKEGTVEQVVRARRFELLDETGNVIAFWGVHSNQQVVLGFENPASIATEASSGSSAPAHIRTVRAAIGLDGDGNPAMWFLARDGQPRIRFLLNEFEKPVLIMDDETGVRVALGHERPDTSDPSANDWSLDFMPERARIGMYVDHQSGQKYLRGFLSVRKDKLKYPSTDATTAGVHPGVALK